jgi:DNA-binding SARP family transcriptional activator
MGFLWPGLVRRAASNNLRSALHDAREVFNAYSGHRYLASEDG